MSTTILIEQAHLVEGTINLDRREVEVVLIRPGWSENGRYYPREVLAKAAALYENAPAFADHPTPDDIKKGVSRSALKLTGRYFNVRLGEQGEIRATRVVYGNPAGDAIWPAIVDSITNRAATLGLSHHAAGKAAKGNAEGRDGVVVESIDYVNSVDDVIHPAAGGGFVSLVAGGDDLMSAVLSLISKEELIAARPELVEAFKREWKVARQDQAVAAALTESTTAKAQVEQLQEAVTQKDHDLASLREDLTRKGLEVELERAFRKANLPAPLEKEIRSQLEEAKPEEWLSILEREQRKAAIMGVKPKPVTVTGAAQRIGQSVVMEARVDAPIDMNVFNTPEKLMAELQRRSDLRERKR